MCISSDTYDTQYRKTCEIVTSYPNPEDINFGLSTAPLKRLINIKSDYNKVIEGNLIGEAHNGFCCH
ncbi:MAG: DUF4276 family protein [Bacteroidales bacterium]|nr:DUF4276 family protein [Bacteroidales bacterium]